MSYRDRADVAQVKGWSEFAGNRAAGMRDIALNFVLPPETGKRGVDQMWDLAGRTSRDRLFHAALVLLIGVGRMILAKSTVRVNEQRPVKHSGEGGDLTAFPMVRCESRFRGFLLAGGLGSPA